MSKKKRSGKEQCCGRSYPDILLSATLVTIALTEGRSNEQLETLLNFINILEENTRTVLTQRLIDARELDQASILLGED